MFAKSGEVCWKKKLCELSSVQQYRVLETLFETDISLIRKDLIIWVKNTEEEKARDNGKGHKKQEKSKQNLNNNIKLTI